MGFADAPRAVESYFAARWDKSVPVAWENAPFDPPETGPWIALSLVGGESRRAGIGPAAPVRHEGEIAIDCHVPVGRGAGPALALADRAVAVFADASPGGLALGAPRIAAAPGGPRAATHFRVRAAIPFRRDEPA